MNSGDLTITDSTVTINATDKGITVTDELTVNVVSDSYISSTSDNAIEAAGALTITSGTGSPLTLSSTEKHAIKAVSYTPLAKRGKVVW